MPLLLYLVIEVFDMVCIDVGQTVVNFVLWRASVTMLGIYFKLLP